MVQNVKDDGSTRRWRTRLVVAVLALMAAVQANAYISSGMGEFYLANGATSTSTFPVTGTYKDPSTGQTGTFTLVQNNVNGFSGTTAYVSINGTRNGIMLVHAPNPQTGNDSFDYTLTVTPDNPFSIPTVKITQTSYTDTATTYNLDGKNDGNSEVAKATLNYTQGSYTPISASATLADNNSVPMLYNAMGDYFMGKITGSYVNRTTKKTFYTYTSNKATSIPQIRIDSSGSDGTSNPLYYYRMSELTKNSNNDLAVDQDGYVYFLDTTEHYGTLPSQPTVTEIIKDTSSNKNNYAPYSSKASLASSSSYVVYGTKNLDSTYHIDITNPKTVRLKHQYIMNGSSAVKYNAIGESFREWISFGISSTAAQPNYTISGKVYHDANANGTLDSGETGLGGVTVKLTDCNGTTKNTTTTASDGSYSFNLGTSLPSTALCVVEPNNLPNYLFDTTPNTIKLALSNTQYSYPNNNFGDSTISPLTLNKYQAANDCNITNLTTLTYSKQPISLTKEQRGQCIAYRIEAVNTGSTALTNVVINDPLMNDAQRVNKVYTQSAQPTLCGSDNTNSTTCDTKKATYNTDEQGVTTITTSGFGLPASGNNKSANLYFNTKYQIK